MLNDYKVDYKNLQKQYEEKANEVNKIKSGFRNYQTKYPLKNNTIKRLKDSTIFFCARISEF